MILVNLNSIYMKISNLSNALVLWMIAKKKAFIFLIMNVIYHVQKIQLIILMIIIIVFVKIIFFIMKKEVDMIAFQVITYA